MGPKLTLDILEGLILLSLLLRRTLCRILLCLKVFYAPKPAPIVPRLYLLRLNPRLFLLALNPRLFLLSLNPRLFLLALKPKLFLLALKPRLFLLSSCYKVEE